MFGSDPTQRNKQDPTPPLPPGCFIQGLPDSTRQLQESSEIQCLQIIHLNLVPCELERGPSVLSTPQSQEHRWHQWSHKPPTVQREKTRLLQRRELTPYTPPQLRGPRRRKRQGILHSGIQGAQGIPGTLVSIPMGLEPTSRRVFLSSVLTNTRPSVD